MHIVKYRDSAVNYAKMAEPVEMQFGMLSWMGSGNMHYMGCRCPAGSGTFRVSG